MIVMTDEEIKAFQDLQAEHEAFWRETLYPPYRPPLKERIWDWVNDHHALVSAIVFVLILALVVYSIYNMWLFAVGIILIVIGAVGYVLWCLAQGIVQWFLDVLL